MKLRLSLSFLIYILFKLSLFSDLLSAQDQRREANSNNKMLNSLILETENKFAPDHRVAIFEVEASADKNGQIYLTGKTNLKVAKEYLANKCEEKKLEVKDSIRLLPDKNLGAEIYGLINLSVANIRSKPGHAAELATQALLGMPVNVLDEKNGWFLIQTPDDYISWVDDWGIKRMTKEQLNEWLLKKKIIYTNPYGISYSQADNHSESVSDLVAGDILRMEGEDGYYYTVIYPDGRKAYVLKGEAQDYDQWLDQANPTAENLISTARKLMGVPYLWGGTSFKGVDCSGFSKIIFFLNGVIIQRDASQQVNSGALVNTDKSYDKLAAGDLLFFGRRAGVNTTEKVSHVAIYLGNLQYINSSGMVRTGSFQTAHPDYSEYRAFSLIRGRRYLGHIGEKGITPIKDSPYYKIHQ
jgi:cell wall-associated NlpC family hydrolase